MRQLQAWDVCSHTHSSQAQHLLQLHHIHEHTRASVSPFASPPCFLKATKPRYTFVQGRFAVPLPLHTLSRRELATGLADCLADLGMLDSRAGLQLLVDTSSSIVDSLPRAGEALQLGRWSWS